MKFVALPNNATRVRLLASFLNMSPYANADDKLRHRRIVERIAEEMRRPVHEVLAVYESVLRRMKTRAAVHDYLSILVSKKIKQAYQQRH